ncbi:uncharacterized protein LOC122372783 isoform X1 [Amphibalanus amphitrite]|nr:uncharacterized protein LOC122372783 isoform X1 [Amphibalanus amphitrite]XP_043206282.1 uncharacterized protein LOC122372783 isoform X1 [Amphibalanus amphitrite]XP_043206283.1 uncharacterized protein LOC122372783 isoform X1 [Amphibalanus amphitrite]
MEEDYKAVCCLRKCMSDLSQLWSDEPWTLAVVISTSPFNKKTKIKTLFIRKVRMDGSLEGLPMSCFILGTMGKRVDGKVHAGDILCLYRSVEFVWKDDDVCPEISCIRAELGPGDGARLIWISVTGRGGCAHCGRGAPAAAPSPRQRVVSPRKPTASPQQPTASPRQPPASPRQPAAASAQQTAISPRQPAASAQEPGAAGRSSSRQPAVSPQQPTVSPRQPAVSPRQPTVSPRQPAVSAQEPGAAGTPAFTSTPPRAAYSGTADQPARPDSPVVEPQAAEAPAPPTAVEELMDTSEDSTQSQAAVFMNSVPASDPSDTYTLLMDIGRNDPGLNQRPNLMGVIVGVPQPPRRTQRSYMVMVVIKDPSCCAEDAPRSDFVVFGFVQSPADLPLPDGDHGLRVGNILRARHVKVEKHGNRPDGRVFRGAALTVFSGELHDPATPLGAAIPPPTVTDAERRRLEWLRRWWALEHSHQERISRAKDAQIGDLVRPGLYNIKCKLMALDEIGGRLFARVEDGTRCPLPCLEPRPDDPDDDPDAPMPSSPSESETQVFRELADRVPVLVSDRRCAGLLRELHQAGARFVQLFRVRVIDVLQDEDTALLAMSLSLKRADEPLVRPLQLDSDDVSDIRLRLEAMAASNPAADREQAPPPVESQTPAAPAPETCPQQPAAGTAASRVETENNRIETGTGTCQTQTGPSRTESSWHPDQQESMEVTEASEAMAASNPAADGEQAPPPVESQTPPSPAPEQRAPCPQQPVADTETSRVDIESNRAETKTGGSQSESASQAESILYPVQQESMEFTDTPSDLPAVSETADPPAVSQTADPPAVALDSPTSSVPASERFATPPQSPDGRHALTAAAFLSPVPFEDAAAQPAERTFRTRCAVRWCVPYSSPQSLRPLLMANCMQPECITQYLGAALPDQTDLNEDLEPIYRCVRCRAEMPLGVALPLELHAIGGRGEPLHALLAGEAAEQLLGTTVTVTSLRVVHQRVMALMEATRSGLTGEVGLLPLDESHRRYMVVDTVLAGIVEG